MPEVTSINEWLRRLLFLPPQSSTIARSIDTLHYVVITATMVGALGVGLMAIYFTVRYRRRTDNDAEQREIVRVTPLWLEALIIGGVFSLFIGFWVAGFIQYTRIRVPPPDTYDIYVTAKQWMWKFAYPEGNHTISELYVPAGRPVKLVMTSRDVIHSLYVPDFRLKQDVIPGRYVTLWFEAREPGRHAILCAEYCGTNHSTMRAEVIVLAPDEFARWLAGGGGGGRDGGRDREGLPAPVYVEPSVPFELGPSQPMNLARLGRQVAAEQGCLRCHSLDGTPFIGPTWAGLYRAPIRLADGQTVIADEAYLTESMMDPQARVHGGFAALMPSYLGRLRPAEVGALLQLIKSLRGVRLDDGAVPAPLAPVGPAQPGAAP